MRALAQITITTLLDGEKGDTGIGIVSTEVKYQSSTSGTTAPTGEWKTSIPTVAAGNYLWTRTVLAYSDGNSSTSYSVSKVGEKGSTGTGIESVTAEYAKSTSKTSAPATGWSETAPEWETGYYIWTRTKIVYNNPTSTEYTTPYCDSSWEAANAVDEKLTTLQTDFTVEQGRIESLIKETTIDNGDGTTTSLKDAYNETKQTVEGNKTTIANVQTNVNTLTGDVESIKSNITEIEQTADGLKTTVSQARSDASNALSVANSANSTANTASSNASSALDKATALETQAANGEFDGRGVSSTKVEYKASTSDTTAPTGTWSTSVPSVANGSYLWTRTTITYTDSTTSVSYSVARMGNDGAKGDTGETGATGADGKGISSITNYYLATSASSGVTTSTSGWQTSPQTVTSTNKYHWNYQKISYTTGNPTTTTPAIIGVYGDTGSQGAAGKGIKSVKTQYYLSTSSTAQSGGSWKDTQDTWSSGKYYWTRDYITWSDDTTSTTTPILATGLNNANSTANTAKSTADTAKSTADAANTTATNAQTIANQTASKFSWIVKSGTSETNFTLTDRTASLVADYINLNGKVTFSGLDSSAQNKINAAQSIADTANSKIDNLQIGGRNLIISNNTVNGWVNGSGTITASTAYKASDYIPVVPGDTITFQLWTPSSIQSWIDDTYFDSDKNYVTGYSGEYITSNHIIKTYIVPEGAAYVRMSYAWATGYKVKLEKGNKATDWTPAPDDKADQSVLDAWNSDTVESDITTINGGYIRTNSITTNQLDTNEIYGNSAFIGAIQATRLNADMITAGTIKSNLLNLYGFKMLNKTTNQESLSITDQGDITMRGSIESYNYHSGKTGWAINSTTDDAEFNNVTVRGSVITNDGGIVSAGGSGRNLQLNTSFYNGLTSWSRGDKYSVDTGFQYKLTNTVKFERSGLTEDSMQWLYSGSNVIRCTVGKSYTAQANFYTKDYSAIDGNGVILGIYFYTSDSSSAGTFRKKVSFTNNQWVHETITAVAPQNAVYVAIVVGAYRNGTFWMAQPKLEEGDVATDWSLAPEDKTKQVRFWAGTSYDERESAPFIVYNDGSIKATQGEFGGVFSGTVDIGNIKIADPSSTAGGDAIVTIQNGDNGIKRVQLTDTNSSKFAQNLIVSDNAYNTMIELGQNGYATFKGGVNVNNNIYLEGSHLTIGGNELTTNSYGFLLNSPQIDVGTVNNTSVLNVYGQSNVNGELKVTKLINYNDTVVATIIAGSSGGIDWDFVV